MRTINEIVIHCSATMPNWMAGKSVADKRRAVRDWHVNGNGWSDIGYHFVIDRDGAVAIGRPVSKTGAHVKGRNTHTIGICLLGGARSKETDRFSKHFTAEQDAELRDMIDRLCREFPTIKKISGHNEYSAKACPGFQVTEWLEGPAPFHVPPADYVRVEPSSTPPENEGGLWAAILAFLQAIFGAFRK